MLFAAKPHLREIPSLRFVLVKEDAMIHQDYSIVSDTYASDIRSLPIAMQDLLNDLKG